MVREALTEKGIKVERQDVIFVPEWGAMVKTADYYEHFVYENPDRAEGAPAHLCTCGGLAMVRGGNANGLFVCMIHEQMGDHSTTFYNVKDIDKVAGKVISLDGKRVRIKDRKRRG